VSALTGASQTIADIRVFWERDGLAINDPGQGGQSSRSRNLLSLVSQDLSVKIAGSREY
jgi:hypothetical protein